MRTVRDAAKGIGVIAAGAAVCLAMGGVIPLAPAAPAHAATAVPDVAKLAGKLSKQKLKWGDCSDGTSSGTAITCAMVEVPRDWKDPANGKTWKFEIAYNRLNDTSDSRYKGIIMGNPGGPGSKGLAMAARLAKALPDAAPFYNFVGFNPRGIDKESRAECEYTVDPKDTNPFAEAEAIGRDCANNPDVKTISTEQTTYDMDFVRHLLGEEKLNFFGYSYGTWLGTWYSNVFHSKAGLMTLDSALDTTQPSYQRHDEFEPWAFKRRQDLWMKPYAERQRSKDSVPPEPGSDDAPPAPSASTQEQEKFLSDEKRSDSALVRETADEQLDALNKLSSLNSSQESAAPTKRKLTSMFYMVRCNDGQYTQGEAYWEKWAEKVKREFKEIRFPYHLSAVQCMNWRTQTKMPKADPQTYPKTIVLQAELDAQTAWEHGRATGVGLPNTRFIAVDNEGNHGLFPYGTEHVDRKVIDFYLTGTLPKKRIDVAQGKPRPDETETYEYWKVLDQDANHTGELVSDPWQKAGTPTVVPVPVEGAAIVRSAELDAAFHSWVATKYGTAGLDLIN